MVVKKTCSIVERVRSKFDEDDEFAVAAKMTSVKSYFALKIDKWTHLKME
jgi:hypothetical protein